MSADFFNKYPYTDFHELNIDWLLTEVKKLLDDYQEIVDWIENDASNYDNLVRRIELLEDSSLSLQHQINAEKIRVDNLFAAEQQRVNSKFDAVDARFITQYDRITREYTSMYSAILTNVNAELADMNNKIDRYKIELIGLISGGDTAVIEYVDARFQTFIDELPDYENLIIYNPVRGIQTNVQTAINDLYTYFNAYALTAQEYDNLQLTADEYDGFMLTAYEYDSMGSQYLGAGFYMMRSPFTGSLAPIPEIINMLFDLHRIGALTASAYDALDMTAAYYDGLDLSAYAYDMNGV